MSTKTIARKQAKLDQAFRDKARREAMEAFAVELQGIVGGLESQFVLWRGMTLLHERTLWPKWPDTRYRGVANSLANAVTMIRGLLDQARAGNGACSAHAKTGAR